MKTMQLAVLFCVCLAAAGVQIPSAPSVWKFMGLAGAAVGIISFGYVLILRLISVPKSDDGRGAAS